jgi:transketolase
LVDPLTDIGRVVQLAWPRAPLSHDRAMANALRGLTIDIIGQAEPGMSGSPLGMADAASMLWTRFLKYDAADPSWPDRDRFVLSAGHGSPLLYALLHLTGHAGMAGEVLRGFRHLHSAAAGRPEYGAHAAIEATTGPLGQGLANAVGMALGERMMAARFGKSLVDHRTWVLASDGDLMEGISHEAASLAGHLRLDKLTVLFDDNGISTDGSTAIACSDDVAKRFAAYGWAVKQVDGHDAAEVANALSFATRSQRPTLIACCTTIGVGIPARPRRLTSSGGWLGGEQARAAKRALRCPEVAFEVEPGVAAVWRGAGSRGAGARRSWLKRLARHPLRAEFERALAGRLPDGWHAAMAALKTRLAEERPTMATRQAGFRTLEALVPAIPELVGGSADLAAATMTQVPAMASVGPGAFGGRYIHWGVREHAMAAAMNGLALHGGLIPYGGTFLAFSDYLRPALRLAAVMRLRLVHVLTHDSIGLGENGPTYQPVEQLASLRAVPNLHVFRPADAIETAECWELALRRNDGPSVLALSRQALPALRADVAENRSARGGYVLAEADGPRRATLIATGSEVALAMAARAALAAESIHVAVVSLPCWELFAVQDEVWRAGVLGSVPRIGIEAACGFGWDKWLGADGSFIGMDGFGASAPGEQLYRHFGITSDSICNAVRKRLALISSGDS